MNSLIQRSSLLLKIIFLITFFISVSSNSIAATKDFVLDKGNLFILAPPVINKNYYLIEFGFVTQKKIKKWDFNYNAYVTAALFEDWLGLENKLHAGGLGFKAGVIVPTQPWVPLLFSLTAGFAKTVLHRNPILGNDDQSVSKKDMFLLETGLLYHYDKYFLRFAYQRSNVRYFGRHAILTMGVNY